LNFQSGIPSVTPSKNQPPCRSTGQLSRRKCQWPREQSRHPRRRLANRRLPRLGLGRQGT
jgi:hypothetical protein